MDKDKLQGMDKTGYCLLPNFYTPDELTELHEILRIFHHNWIADNRDFYQQRAINSAYLTGKKYLQSAQRKRLFDFLASHKLMEIVTAILANDVCFMNTQLFFDPVQNEQKNYWHRDPQYHLTLQQQQEALTGPRVMHVRIPLVKEHGLELVPGSHRQWDTQEELQVRLEQEGHKNHEDLSSGLAVPLNVGDVLVFNANMIHRGLYGNDRLALDILFCDPIPELLQFVDESCLPEDGFLNILDNGKAFSNTLKIKASINQQQNGH
ncbi:phytanoyl-CoA dioxygenase family protein [Planctobacterium marinum]|uniref:Phytanoyl-CoA dioxygenase n=1 Tax=Planctobacterium marinum TaxID=1631968 RepID=A0AA48HXN0_9ALTE|nr:hypothetical protein MACH26_20110 [Planctobacterium marinum]